MRICHVAVTLIQNKSRKNTKKLTAKAYFQHYTASQFTCTCIKQYLWLCEWKSVFNVNKSFYICCVHFTKKCVCIFASANIAHLFLSLGPSLFVPWFIISALIHFKCEYLCVGIGRTWPMLKPEESITKHELWQVQCPCL